MSDASSNSSTPRSSAADGFFFEQPTEPPPPLPPQLPANGQRSGALRDGPVLRSAATVAMSYKQPTVPPPPPPRSPPANGKLSGPPAASVVDTVRVNAARSLWRKMEQHAKEVSKKPTRTTTIEEAARALMRSKKAAARFAKFDLRNDIARVLSDPQMFELNLSSNTQFAALTSQQKARRARISHTHAAHAACPRARAPTSRAGAPPTRRPCRRAASYAPSRTARHSSTSTSTHSRCDL